MLFVDVCVHVSICMLLWKNVFDVIACALSVCTHRNQMTRCGVL